MSSLDEFTRLNTRKASVVEVGGFRPTGDPLSTHFCLTPVALPGEGWPEHNGAPLGFICQLNVASAPAIPELLKDIALITFFIGEDAAGWGRINGDGWQLRSYQNLDSLAPLNKPQKAPVMGKGFECRWKACDDHPKYDDPDLHVAAGFNASESSLDNVLGTKIGGYASNIQSEQWWGILDPRRTHEALPAYCLQIDSEEKVGLSWGDAGTLYIARGTAPGHDADWFLDWQCY